MIGIPSTDLTFSVHQSKPAKSRRYIPQSSEKTLDAPDIQDNFYLNLLDWGCLNVLAIALDNKVYLWDGFNGSVDPEMAVKKLVIIDDEDGPAAGVS
ncbi:hypothetical protein Dsin_006957 [Dipteronia sinensis]|uniref:Uncharacterized protein n=1 Tax=Dipteronia sinensis TaxID=43782 RepID=A0AAE0EHY7_9ROSI|nr:hypothetical protein Dsin_006957 [Dipteronia sinensis]